MGAEKSAHCAGHLITFEEVLERAPLFFGIAILAEKTEPMKLVNIKENSTELAASIYGVQTGVNYLLGLVEDILPHLWSEIDGKLTDDAWQALGNVSKEWHRPDNIDVELVKEQLLLIESPLAVMFPKFSPLGWRFLCEVLFSWHKHKGDDWEAFLQLWKKPPAKQ